MREERKRKIDDQLRTEIDQNQKSEQCVRKSIKRTERQKQDRRQIAHNGHANIDGVTR